MTKKKQKIIKRKVWIKTLTKDGKDWITGVHFTEPKVAYVGQFSYTMKGSKKPKLAPIFQENFMEGELTYKRLPHNL